MAEAQGKALALTLYISCNCFLESGGSDLTKCRTLMAAPGSTAKSHGAGVWLLQSSHPTAGLWLSKQWFPTGDIRPNLEVLWL